MKIVKSEHRICDVLCSYFVCVILMCHVILMVPGQYIVGQYMYV